VRRALRSLAVLLLALLGASCSRGPDPAGLERDVQARLDALFGRQVLLLRDLNRQGSAPFAVAADGTRQAVVYFNARLALTEAYDPSDWEELSPQLIAAALGATDEGIVGLGSGRLQPGAELRAYGSLVYRRDGDAWRPTDLPLPQRLARPPAAADAAQTRSDELIKRLAQVVDTSPGLRGAEDQIVAEELDRALQNIRLRLDRGATRVTVATGPEGGEYARFMGSVSTRLGDADPISVAVTEGSVANAFLVDRGNARFGLVQSDVAAAAVTGEGLFATTGPLRHLRAVASLFPEPVHVVVRADSGIVSVSQLVGRRVALGRSGSGTRHTTLRVLAAHGVDAGSFTDVEAQGPLDALEQLAGGQVDAVIEVVAAPWSQLSQWSARVPLELLPLDPAAIERVAAEVHGLVPLVVPARTYPGQDADRRSVAATALLVANSDVGDAAVSWVLEFLFAPETAPARGVSAARLSRERAREGITIPLHDGAARFFADGPPPP
jgi:TRAP transporter TAXI family solute receptor